jgi:tellurite resistance protein TehA-like permease
LRGDPFPRKLRAWCGGEIAALHPGCFAVVMATGIVSNALFLQGYRELSDALFAVNLVAYLWLALAMLCRLLWFRRALCADLLDPRLVFSFFTIVAGTDVFAVGLHLRGLVAAALLLWLFALLFWLVLIYVGFAVLTFLNPAHGADVVHGAWLIAIVGTESLVVLGTLIGPGAGSFGEAVFVLIHILWGVGLGLYGIFIVLFAHRIFFFDVRPDDITPVLWVVMGAAAISANAGSTLALTDSGVAFLEAMRPFIDGVTLLMWAWASFWIPLLVVLGIWKHGVRRVPLTYTPMLWSLVFPLGMYALASLRFSRVTGFPPLRDLSYGIIWVAVAAWVATSVGLVAATWRHFRQFNGASAAAEMS